MSDRIDATLKEAIDNFVDVFGCFPKDNARELLTRLIAEEVAAATKQLREQLISHGAYKAVSEIADQNTKAAESRIAALQQQVEALTNLLKLAREKAVYHVGKDCKIKCNCPESCEHKWDGPAVEIANGASVTCSRCGMTAMEHHLWVMP